MRQKRESVHDAARIAGLRNFETPTLEGVERRRFQLWVMTLLLLLALTAGFAVAMLRQDIFLPRWATPALVQAGFVGLVVLFCVYAIEKEVQLRRLTNLLVEERVLTAALTSRVNELSTLLEAGKAVNLELDLDQVFDRILACVSDLLDAHDASIMLRRGEEELYTVALTGESMAGGARVLIGEGVCGKVAEELEPHLISGVIERSQGRAPKGGERVAESAMSVPLVHRGELLGVLNVNAKAGRTYTEHDLRALDLFGEQAATAIANARLYETQRLATSRQTHQALHDPLTGLPNRILLVDRVEHSLARRRHESRQPALLFVDLDDFKLVNDSLGHSAGDEVLIAFARRLRSGIREGDSVARFGGDEFAVLVEDVQSPSDAMIAAGRVRRSLEEPLVVGDREIHVGASIGIALRGPSSATAEEMLQRADTALHVAKTRGRHEIVIFEESMHSDAVFRLDLASELHEAITSDQLRNHYQPIVRLTDRDVVVGVEALVRWDHPRRGFLSAESFVPFAADAGLLSDLDRWVFRNACEELGSLDDALRRDLTVYVNISWNRLKDSNFFDEIERLTSDEGVSAHQLVFEITESSLLGTDARLPPHLTRLRALGVRFALDDFGTGYSSLSHLDRMPIDQVKIDRSFVDGMGGEEVAEGLVPAIVRLGENLNLEIIAEGIEHESQLRRLLDLGCDLGQGFLLSPPMAIADLRTWLSTEGRSRSTSGAEVSAPG